MLIDKAKIRKYLIVISSMGKQIIKKQYKNSVLGIIWTVLNPLLNMLVLAFIFSHIFQTGTDGLDYPVYILSGNIVFGLLRTTTTMGLQSLVNNSDLITKTQIPYSSLPVAATIASILNFLFSCIALVFVMLIRIPKGVSIHWHLLLIGPLWLPAIVLFSLGIGLFLSQLFVRFRDTQHLYSVFLIAWTYATPIFYPESILPGNFKIILNINPMYYFVKSFRLLLLGELPNIKIWLILYGLAIVSMLIGVTFFKYTKKKTVLYL